MRARSPPTHIHLLAPAALAASLALVGCGPLATPQEAATAQGLTADNGLSMNGLAMNGLSMNGMSMNGMSMNGLSMNGLSMNGLSTTDFATWFGQDPATANVVMGYVARCALASGKSLTYSYKTATGKKATTYTYTWSGLFGLAPGWAAGSAISELEQQVMTGCLLAHANKYGVHVPISVQGRGAGGAAIPLEAGELTTYSAREGCFFGNLFTGEGVFSAQDHASWDAKTSTARACALDTNAGASAECPPIVILGTCGSYCTLDTTKNFYESCTYNGKTYRPVTTRLRAQDVYKCGDGVCQFTESCGNGADWDNCKPDCGLCP